jgi:hypothetical protein
MTLIGEKNDFDIYQCLDRVSAIVAALAVDRVSTIVTTHPTYINGGSC